MKPRSGLRLALCAAGASATLGFAACGSAEHRAPTANAAASATTGAATAPADVHTRSGRVFPGEGAPVPPHSHASSHAAGASTAASPPLAAASASTVVSGRYIGPPHNGANRCGYVAVGPGLEQASAFVVHGVDCATARELAAAKRHLSAGSESYRALGFDCVSAASSATLRRFNCTAGAAAVSFIVS